MRVTSPPPGGRRPLGASDARILRDAAAIAAAVGVIGMSFGVLATASGASLLEAQAMSLLVCAGASQFVLIAGIGGGLAAAVVAGLLLNARHIAFGLAVAPLIDGPLWRRALAGQIVLDESTGYALAQSDARSARRGFYAVGVLIFLAWQLGTAVGALAGAQIDYLAFGVDAAFPASLLAMLGPQLATRAARLAGLGGVGVSLAATPALPRGLPIILAGLAGAAAFLLERRAASR